MEKRKEAIRATQAWKDMKKVQAEKDKVDQRAAGTQPQQPLPEPKESEGDYEEVPSGSEDEEAATSTAKRKPAFSFEALIPVIKVRMRAVPAAAPIPMPDPEGFDCPQNKILRTVVRQHGRPKSCATKRCVKA